MKKKMINAVTPSHSEPICKTTTVSVKENETFALFSGIVVHNTLNTFHKA